MARVVWKFCQIRLTSTVRLLIPNCTQNRMIIYPSYFDDVEP